MLNLYKAGITGREADIHMIRSNIKKIRAFYHFLEVIYQGKFKKEEHYAAFKELFRQAGKLREVHVNLMILEQYTTHAPEEKDFRSYLQKKEMVLARKFLYAVRDYDETAIISKEKEIEKFMNKLQPKKFSGNVDKFIKKKSSRILGYLPEIRNPLILHKIRMHLKTISSILDISLKCSRELNETEHQLLTEIIGMETLIGIWHDNIVFIEAIKTYRKSKSGELPETQAILEPLGSKLNLENTTILERIEKMIPSLIVDSILSKPRWNLSVKEDVEGKSW